MKNQINIYIREACRKGLVDGVFSGVSAAVSIAKNKIYHRSLFSGGTTQFNKREDLVDKNTFFDLASLTKPLCTTLGILHLVATEKIHLEEPCAPLIGFKTTPENENLKIHHLLRHSSGLPSYKPYFKQFGPEYSENNRNLLIKKIMGEQIAYAAGTSCQYSDLGFILLGAVLEEQNGTDIDTLYRRIITDPLNISHELCFLPLGPSFQRNERSIAATEVCGWRKKLLQGEVHDENCWLMGGVAGHAGLFGTIGGVLTLCETILDIWKDRGSHQAFPNTLLQQALTQKHPTASWCLGFDTPTPAGSSSGRYFSKRSVGHLGFSGTSFWIDPDRDMIMVLLSNRIHPSRENVKIRKFRPYFHNYLMEKIGFNL